MALSYPIDPGRPQVFKQQPVGSELSSANAYRGLDGRIVAADLDLVHFDPDSGAWVPAIDPSLIGGLLARSVRDATGPGTLLSRGAEVSDGAIRYGDLDRDVVNARLYELGIIVRPAVAPPE